MLEELRQDLRTELDALKQQGLYKTERILQGPQGAEVMVNGRRIINFCANNYLGLASDPRVVQAAAAALEVWGYGMSSVRFICGTTELHKQLEAAVSELLGTEDTILYAACFDANGGVFEPLLGDGCAIITDQLNHASIIDGTRLAKAKRVIYQHNDMDDLAAKLEQTAGATRRLIVTDGVFSMDGEIARLDRISELAAAHNALLMVDDSHATGIVGPGGAGTPAKFGIQDRVDIVTTTFGKALGGALGGCTSGRAEIIDWLRQKSRPYLFSNSLPPMICAATLEVLRILKEDVEPRQRLDRNGQRLCTGLRDLGFDVGGCGHPIVPVHFRTHAEDARLARDFASDLLEEGIYVIGFSFPVVPHGQARIRMQLSAAHTEAQIDRCLEAFARVGRRRGVIK